MTKSMRGPLARYTKLVETGSIEADPVQAEAARRLQALTDALTKPASLLDRLPFGRAPAPKGLYLWGGVGRGKSLLMDIFFNNTDVKARRRVHFHEFMAEAHERINDWRAASPQKRRAHKAWSRKAPDDPMPLVGYDLAQKARLFCFDEFQATDIADAMIMGRLFSAMFDNGAVMVTTSNRHPDDLYKDGINRQLFVPTIELIKSRLDVFELAAARDYRLERLQGSEVYHSPLGAKADAGMDAAWESLICGAQERPATFKVKGRTIEVPRAARGAARFDFEALCARPLGASDYLALVRRYNTLFIDHIPAMGPQQRNEARRFVTLIDAIYEARTKLVCSADAAPQDLYASGDGAFEFERTASRLIEMQSADYLGAEHIDIAAAE